MCACVSDILPSVLPAVAEQFDHVGEEQSPHLHELSAGGRVLQQRGHYLQYHCERDRETQRERGGGTEALEREGEIKTDLVFPQKLQETAELAEWCIHIQFRMSFIDI